MKQCSSSQSTASSTKERGNGEHSQCFEADAPLNAILSCIERHHKVLILMRGVPGSGKSHLARQLKAHGSNGGVFSTDDLFNTPNGFYQFDQNKLSDYHAQNYNRVRDAIGEERNPIIVDNTNIYGVHMKPYINLAVKNGYEVYFVEPDTQWKFSAKECARINVHDVPKSTIQDMLDNYEKKVSLEHLMRPTKLLITAGSDHASLAAGELPISLPISPRSSSVCSEKSSSGTESQSNSCVDILDDGLLPTKNEEKPPKGKTSASTQESPRTSTPSKRQWKLPDGLSGGWMSGLQQEEPSPTPSLVTLSLEPPATTLKVWCASRAVQVNDCRLLLANIAGDQLGPQTQPEAQGRSDGIACDESFLVEQPKKRPPRSLFKERAVQTVDSDRLTSFDQLVAIFPDEDVEQLAHVLDSCGDSIEQAISILLDGGGSARRDGHAAAVLPALRTVHSSSSNEYPVDVIESAPESELNESAAEGSLLQRNDDDATIPFVLDERMADHLQRMFGPVTTEGLPAELLSPSQRRVRVPLDLALKLHQLWMQTQMQSDDYSEEPSMEGLDYSDTTPPGSTVNDLFRDTAWPTHKDRMVKSDEEYARMLQERINAEDRSSSAQQYGAPSTGSMTLAENMKLDKLIKIFPSFDPVCIKDMYDTNGRSFDLTKKTLLQYLEADEPSSSEVQPEPTITYSLAFDAKRSVDEQLPQGPLDYNNLHQESRYHAQKRNECYVKAKNAFQERKPQVAAYYAQEGRNHDRMLNAANERAKNLIVKTRERQNPDNLLDLHGLHVDEALETLKEKLDSFDRPVEKRNGPGRKLQVVTGHGVHSKGGAKLKPAINQWLRQKGYKFEQTNPGEVHVYCK